MMYCTYHELKYASPNLSKNKQTRATQKCLPLGRRTKEEIIEKRDQPESPEIPDRIETSEISGLPLGGRVLTYNIIPMAQQNDS